MSGHSPHVDVGPLLRGELGPTDRALAWAHVARCASCRAQYDAQALALRALTGDVDGDSPIELEATLDAVLHEVAPPLRRRVVVPVAAGLSIMAAAAVAFTVGRAGYRERGSDASVGVKALCVQGPAPAVLGPGGACPAGARVVVAVRLPSGRRAAVRAVLMDAAGAGRTTAARAVEGGAEVLLPESLETGSAGAAELLVVVQEGSETTTRVIAFTVTARTAAP